MRFEEIFGFDLFETNLLEYSRESDDRNPTDPATGLKMNLPNQWSKSPYLFAVHAPKGDGYVAQIHIPQGVWDEMVDGKQYKWANAPKSFFERSGKDRPSMVVGKFADPRQAAWYGQQVLLGDRADEYIEDYFDERYNGGDGSIWRSLKAKVPSFDGKPLELEDRDEFFSSNKKKSDEQNAIEKQEAYNRKFTKVIKDGLTNLYLQNPALAKKRLAKYGYTGSRNQLPGIIDQVFDDKGLDFFMKRPGSVEIKDLPSLTF